MRASVMHPRTFEKIVKGWQQFEISLRAHNSEVLLTYIAENVDEKTRDVGLTLLWIPMEDFLWRISYEPTVAMDKIILGPDNG